MARVNILKQAEAERDEARLVIAKIAEELGLDSASTGDQVVEAARSRAERLSTLVGASGAGPDEAWPAVVHRVRTARDYVRMHVRGGAA